MSTTNPLDNHREAIMAIGRQYGVTNIRVFGSTARGQSDKESDVDLLIDLDPDRGLLDRAGFMLEVSKLLGVPVDVITERGLKPRIREQVMQEAVML